jgi:radical SAM protein with 4Fe4S-binding SPASM domain
MEDISTDEWKKIIRIFKDEAKIPFFSFSGGEPLLRNDLEELIAYASHIGLEVNLVSNGTLADAKRAASLYRAGLRTAQISVEAGEAALHDELAGRSGAFDETVRGIAALQKAGISVQTNTTITRRNMEAAAALPAWLSKIGINRFAMNMYSPASPPVREDLLVAYDEIGAVVDKVRKAAFASGLVFYWYSPTPFCHYNPVAKGMGNKSCAAADGLISAAANGDLLPCSSWDEPIGNLLQKPFDELWFSERAQFFKHKHFAPSRCKSCASFAACQGACPLYWRACGEVLLKETS